MLLLLCTKRAWGMGRSGQAKGQCGVLRVGADQRGHGEDAHSNDFALVHKEPALRLHTASALPPPPPRTIIITTATTTTITATATTTTTTTTTTTITTITGHASTSAATAARAMPAAV